MIETYKIVSGKENTNRENLFQMETERGNSVLFRGEKIFKKRSRKGLRANCFSKCDVNPQNKLSKNEVQAKKTSGSRPTLIKNEVNRRRVRNKRMDRDYMLLYSVVLRFFAFQSTDLHSYIHLINTVVMIHILIWFMTFYVIQYMS